MKSETRSPTEPVRIHGSALARMVERAGLMVLLAVIGWFYVWSARSSGANWNFGHDQPDYYNLLIHGWREGHLYLKADVPEALLRSPDPYDPAQRPAGIEMHDASLYHGRYYLYFGVGPAIVAMLPFRLLTGVDLPLGAAMIAFAYGGFLASLAILLEIRRRYFADGGMMVVWLCTLVLGIAGLGPVLLRRTEVWELPIASGYCFIMLALWCAFRALHARGWRWDVAASVFLGIAVASRPTYLAALPMLVLLWLGHWRQSTRRFVDWWQGEGIRFALAGLVPVAVVGMLLAWHNYARFGNPLEFGQKYQLSSVYEGRLVHFSLRYVPVNAWFYFVAPAQWTRSFPFINGIVPPQLPSGYGGFADVYGVFSNLPIAWLALFAPLALRRRTESEKSSLGPWLGIGETLFGAIAVFVLFFLGAHGRYMLDFTPSLMLLAAVGILALERAVRSASPLVRWVSRTGWAIAIGYSVIFAVLFSITATNTFHEYRPGDYDALGRKLNYVSWWLEKVVGTKYGPVDLSLKLAAVQQGERQSLVTTGDKGSMDTVFIERVTDQRFRLGAQHEGGSVQLSRPFFIDQSRLHRVRIYMGSLFPNPNHPLYRGLAERVVSQWTERVLVAWDDQVLFDAPQSFHPASPATVRVGPDAGWPGATVGFRGQVLEVRRAGLKRQDLLIAPRECVRLRVRLSGDMRARQPLVSFVTEDRDGLIYMRREEDGRWRFGLFSKARNWPESEAIALPDGRIHEFVFEFPKETSGRSMRSPFQLLIDGVSAWSVSNGPILRPGTELTFGRNESATPGFATRFGGDILSHEQFEEGADPLTQTTGPLRLDVRLPRAPGNGRDPLLVVGRAGAADFLCLEYTGSGAVRFGYDHWGSALVESEIIPAAPGTDHRIDVSLDSLTKIRPQQGATVSGNGELVVMLDQVVVWRARVPFYWTTSGDFFVGANPVGGSSCGERFSGEILSAKREPTGR